MYKKVGSPIRYQHYFTPDQDSLLVDSHVFGSKYGKAKAGDAWEQNHSRSETRLENIPRVRWNPCGRLIKIDDKSATFTTFMKGHDLGVEIMLLRVCILLKISLTWLAKAGPTEITLIAIGHAQHRPQSHA